MLLQTQVAPTLPTELLIATDCFDAADVLVHAALLLVIDKVAARFATAKNIVLAAKGPPAWCAHQRRLQSFESERTSAAWIDATNPRFSFKVAGAA